VVSSVKRLGPGVSNCSEGQMRAYKVAVGPRCDY